MKKKLLVFIFVLVTILALGVVAIATEAEVKEITISYMKEQNTTSDTTTLDKVAYENGKQTVKAGEEFTLPTTADNKYAGLDGFQLVWYTENGHTYKGGETVSFNEDTKLFRCVARESYTMSDVNYGMTNESGCAILMADIITSDSISVWNQGNSVLILNGFTMSISKNGSIMGSQRSGKHIYGEGTINVTNPDGKIGTYSFFSNQSHSYNGALNRCVVGVDVTINAPSFMLGVDGDGATTSHYPWTRVYGNINCYNLGTINNNNNRAPFFEFFEGCQVTINGNTLFNNNNSSIKQSMDVAIYGGTFNLPAAASSLEFWMLDDADSTDYTVKDNIAIFGGNFITADGSAPAISSFLGKGVYYVKQTSGNGLYNNNSNDTTMKVQYYDVTTGTFNNDAYVFKFVKATEASDVVVDSITERRRTGTVVVTDNMDGSATGEYTYNIVYNKSTWAVLSFSLTNTDGTEITDFKFALGLSNFAFITDDLKVTMSSAEFEVDSKLYTTVVPGGCEHNYTGSPVDASCEHSAYADYNCTKCGHNAFFTWGEKSAHNMVLGEHIEATLTSLGSKTYSCSTCSLVKVSPYNLEPSNLDISVKIKNDDGTFEEITVLASDVFEFSTSGSNGDYIYTLSAIKAFADYKIRNIYGITIPKGILYINIKTHNEEKYNNEYLGLVELNIAEGARVDIQNIGNLRKVEKITVGKNANVVFSASCSWYSPNNEKRDMQKIATIDLSAGNHTVTFMPSAFNGRGTVANLLLGENASYDFKNCAFYNCAITELKFPATSTYTFSGEQNFYGNDMTELVFPDGVDLNFSSRIFENCPNLTSVTFGKNATYNISYRCFTYSPIAKVVLTSDSTYTIGQYAFTNTSLEEIDMSAGNMTVTLNNGAFNCWLDNKRYGNVAAIKFGENSTYVIGEGSLNDTIITEIKLAPNSQYTFKKFCINGGDNKKTFKTLDASANGITLVIEGEAFRYHTAFDTLKINGEGSTYTFNTNALLDTKIAEITLGKGSTYTFNNCFNGSTPLAKIDASADNLNVTVNNYGFGKSSITSVSINGKNGTYTFNSEAFRNSNFTELTLGEGSTYEFKNNSLHTVNKLVRFDAGANNITLTVGDYVFSGKTTLTEVNISGENSAYTFGREAFNNVKITGIKAGKNSTYSFGQQCFKSCSALTTVDFTASNIIASFINSTFSGVKTISYIAFGENSTYTIDNYAFYNTTPTNDIVFSNTSTFTIGREAFRYADFASITFEDNCDVTFTGIEAFRECDKAKTLYIGRNIAITNYPFKLLKALEALYIMEGVTHASEWEFEYAGSDDYSTPLYVYNHSLDFVFNKGLFNECDGIFVYTITDNIGTSGEVFRACGDTNGFKGWTVYLGLAHPLTNYVVDPDCENNGYNTWVADSTKCPCGSLTYFEETTVINKYEKKHNITADTAVDEAITFTVTPIAPLGHDKLGKKTNIAYKSYLEKGAVSYICTRCDKEHTVENDADALFVFIGYSMPEDGRLELSIGYIVNKDAIAEYELLAETTISYGVVCAIADQLNGKAPLDKELEDSGKVLNVSLSKSYSAFDFVVSGFKKDQVSIGLVMSMYVVEGDDLVYLQYTQTDNPSAYSISQYLIDNSKVSTDTPQQ